MVSPTMKLVLFLTALTSICAKRPCPVTGTKKCPLDLAFVLDSSESVLSDNFDLEKKVSMGVVDSLPELRLKRKSPSSERILSWRLALLQYSSHVETSLTFSKALDDLEVKRRILNLKYIRQGTRTIPAIETMTDIYKKESFGSSVKVALLFVDEAGLRELSSMSSVVTAAKENHNITIITVGIKRENRVHCQLARDASPRWRSSYCNLEDENFKNNILDQIVELANKVCPEPSLLQSKPICNCTKGEDGMPGPKGMKGSPGDDGRPGTNGLKGEPGLGGISGRPGPEGKPGSKGDTGERGKCGDKGIKGDTGPPGPDGAKGMTGQKGGPGRPGDKGPEGIPGKQGERGYPGEKGPKGDAQIGPPGPTGDQGLNGRVGLHGLPGIGQTGIDGPRGPAGVQGPKGTESVGYPGPKGDHGLQGHKGSKGDTAVGPNGTRGEPGHPGYRGAMGPPGVGIPGDPGHRGNTGEQGLRGEDGIGARGPQGERGYSGPPGLKGDSEDGEPGPPGEPGADGVDGHPGYKGEDGAPGQQGEIGLKGSQGPDGQPGKGTQGEQGDPGHAGGRGLPGRRGHNGHEGAKGEPGTVGRDGTEGAPGPNLPGPEGPVGLAGPPGTHGLLVKGEPGDKGERGHPGSPGQLGLPGRGHPGSEGPDGLKGLQGEPGRDVAGYPGPKGDFGSRGYQGDVGQFVMGDKGPPGNHGSPGPLGPPGPPGLGPQGTMGEPGHHGETGPKGPPGDGHPGEMGDRGFKGEKGPPGERGYPGGPGQPGGPGEPGPTGVPEVTRECLIQMIREICGCGVKCEDSAMELVFIVDGSESIGMDNFATVREFVRDLVDRFTVGPSKTRIGLVLYSQNANVEFDLDHYQTKDQIKNHIINMKYIAEGTNTGTAIRLATREVFSNARKGVRKVAIVITDGQTDPNEPVKLEDAVREAHHDHNIDMHAVGIHPRDSIIDRFLNELNLIASHPDKEHVHHIEEFNLLSALESKLLREVCRDTTGNVIREDTSTPCTSTLIKTVVIPPGTLASTRDHRCNLPMKKGGCHDYKFAYFYDKQDNNCKNFWYGGCDGNDNRFKTQEECTKTCVLSGTDE